MFERILYRIVYILFGVMVYLSLTNTAGANDIYVNQVGDNATINITQDGDDNRVSRKEDTVSSTPNKATMVGKNQTLNVTQTGQKNFLGLYKHYYGSDTQTSSNMTATQTGDDNIMRLDNHGVDNDFTAVQETDGSTMDLEVDGNDHTIVARQKCSELTCNADTMIVNSTGNNNSMDLGQGYKITAGGVWYYDSQEHGGHHMDVLINNGSNNVLKLSQRSNNNTSDHNMDVNIYSDGNDLHVIQEHNVDKTLTLTINNDDNTVSLHQRKAYGHTATVELDGTYPTDLDVQQGTNSTTSALSYSLYQNCQTVGGCSVTVTQN